MQLIKSINDKLFQLFVTYNDVEYYLRKWHECDDFGNWENFNFKQKNTKDNQLKIDAIATLHSMPGDLLLKIAIDLGIETPDYIPSIPLLRNELKSSYEAAFQTFEKAFKNVEQDPNIAIGLANSALESVIKTILKDKRLGLECDEKDTLYRLTKNICNAFGLHAGDSSCPKEVQTIASSLLACAKSVETLRSNKTEMHGKTDNDVIINDSLTAYFIVNAVSTVGLFFLNFYKAKFSGKKEERLSNSDELPF